jgi:hypothetical protein
MKRREAMSIDDMSKFTIKHGGTVVCLIATPRAAIGVVISTDLGLRTIAAAGCALGQQS